MNPTPRQFFTRHNKEERDRLAIVLNEAWFQRCVLTARAELSTRDASKDFLLGAQAMINTLYLLAEGEDAPVATHPPDPVLKTYSTNLN